MNYESNKTELVCTVHYDCKVSSKSLKKFWSWWAKHDRLILKHSKILDSKAKEASENRKRWPKFFKDHTLQRSRSAAAPYFHCSVH